MKETTKIELRRTQNPRRRQNFYLRMFTDDANNDIMLFLIIKLFHIGKCFIFILN